MTPVFREADTGYGRRDRHRFVCLSFDGETRKLSVRAVIGTVYGETTIQEVF